MIPVVENDMAAGVPDKKLFHIVFFYFLLPINIKWHQKTMPFFTTG